MKFDESRVYTALNADKLKVGSRVIVADNIALLKKRVSVYYDGGNINRFIKIEKIMPEQYESRFAIHGEFTDVCWSLAYLVAEPDNIDCTDDKSSDYLMRLLSENIDKHNHLVAYKTILDKYGLLKEAEDLLTEILR
jgi:hypothetical protein